MLIPIIKINDGGYEHIVGTNSHDQLYVDEETGGIQYLNLQCCEGTKVYTDDEQNTINFIGKDEDGSAHPLVEFVTIEELLIIATENMEKQTDAYIRLDELAKKYFEKKDESLDKLSKLETRNTSGMLPS